MQIFLYLSHCFVVITGLAGSDNVEEAHVRSLYDVLGDSMEAYIKVVFCENQEEQGKRMKEYRETTLPNHLKPFTNRLNAQQKWLVGDKVSFY